MSNEPALVTYMETDDPAARDAAFLRTYAERVRDRTAVDWEIPNSVASTLDGIATRIESRKGAQLSLLSDPVFVELLKQLAAHPTHHNHEYTEPDDFEIGVQDCQRCEAFFALPFCIIEHFDELVQAVSA